MCFIIGISENRTPEKSALQVLWAFGTLLQNPMLRTTRGNAESRRPVKTGLRGETWRNSSIRFRAGEASQRMTFTTCNGFYRAVGDREICALGQETEWTAALMEILYSLMQEISKSRQANTLGTDCA